MSVPWNKGKKLSPETCLKMSLSRRGEKHPMWGKHHSDETKRKIKENHRHIWRGRHHTKESIEKCRLAHLGRHHTAEAKKKISEHNARPMLGKHPVSSMKGKIHSEETKQRMRKPKSDEHRAHISSGRKGMKFTDEHRKSISKVQLNRSPEIIRKCLLRHPKSCLEKRFEEIVTKLSLPYKFVGNGDFFIERKNPDFINTNHLKVAIEVYCRHHKEHFRGGVDIWKQERSEIFGRYGWRVEFFDETQVDEAEVARRLM